MFLAGKCLQVAAYRVYLALLANFIFPKFLEVTARLTAFLSFRACKA